MTYLCVFHMASWSKAPDFIHFQYVAVLTTLNVMHTKFLMRGPSAIIQLLWTNGHTTLSLKHFGTSKRLNNTEIFESQYFTTNISQYFTTVPKSVFYNKPHVSILQQSPNQYFTTNHKSVIYNKPQVSILQQTPSQYFTTNISQYFTTVPKSEFYNKSQVSILQQTPSQ